MGFWTAELKHYSTWGHSTELALDFLAASSMERGDAESEASIAAYFSDVAIEMLSASQGPAYGEAIALPEPPRVRTRFADVISRRRSARSFTQDTLPLEFLSFLLWASAGETGFTQATTSDGDVRRLALRAVASGGGLYPVVAWVIASGVEGLAPRAFLYEPRGHTLRDSAIPARQVLDAMVFPDRQTEPDRIPLVVVFAAAPWRSMRKYGERGMRFAIHEVGGMAHSLGLAATSLGLASCDWASFYESEMDSALDIRWDGFHSLHTVLIGYPA